MEERETRPEYPMFRESSIYYQSDLMWMGAAAFRFYLPAVVRFVRHEAADISDFVAHFAGTLEYRLEHEPQELAPVATQLAELCDYIIEHWPSLEAGTEPYGDVGVQYMSLREACSGLGRESERR